MLGVSLLYSIRHRLSKTKINAPSNFHFPSCKNPPIWITFTCFLKFKMGSGGEVGSVMVDEVSFPSQITISKPLSLLGHGITDIEIHFLQIKFTAIGVYLDPQIVSHLQKWNGQTPSYLQQDDQFFDAIISAPTEKLIRVVVIKEIKGSQYSAQLESAVRDSLAEVDKYEEEEEEALDKIVEFFQTKYLKKHSVITFYFTTTESQPTAQIGFASEEKEEAKMEVKNGNVVEMILKWYLGGSRGVSPTLIVSLANGIAVELSK